MERSYVSIDLKSFFASVECVERGLNPLTTNLVVADSSRTEKTICLAVTPSLKSYGISGRARLFEVVQRVGEINAARRRRAPGGTFTGKSYSDPELKKNSALELDYIVAKPQMSHYIEMSTKIYDIYMKYVAPEDVHVYSIDEVFIDLTAYLKTYGLTARELTQRIILDVLRSTGITATAGIGTNLYLSKIAMDIVAKHIEPDADGVRIAELTEQSYREQLWEHRPLTDFWRVGRGYAKKLEAHGMYTMGDVALRAEYDEDSLYKLFGVNAGLLIDHAWGYEPCTIADIKAYRPGSSSLGSGQVLQCPYTFDKARIIVREMTEQLVLELVEKRLVTDQIILDVGYDIESLSRREGAVQYKGEVVRDGSDVAIIANGLMVYEAIVAAQALAAQGIDAMVINMATIKPLDEELVLSAAKKCGKVITCEEHSVIGGLGEAVCGLLSEKLPTKVVRIGVNDEFGHSGPAAALLKQFGLSAEHIVEVAAELCK